MAQASAGLESFGNPTRGRPSHRRWRRRCPSSWPCRYHDLAQKRDAFLARLVSEKARMRGRSAATALSTSSAEPSAPRIEPPLGGRIDERATFLRCGVLPGYVRCRTKVLNHHRAPLRERSTEPRCPVGQRTYPRTQLHYTQIKVLDPRVNPSATVDLPPTSGRSGDRLGTVSSCQQETNAPQQEM